MSKPQAWTIVDLSAYWKQFSVSDSPAQLVDIDSAVQANGTSTPGGGVFPTEADKQIGFLATNMHQDPIGKEDYATAYQTTPNQKAFASYHHMLLGARGEQHFHFHPPGRDNGTSIKDSSIRHVILYPLWHMGKEEGGITLEWFETTDTHLVNTVDVPDHPFVNATAVGPKYTLNIPPGHIALVTFDAGAHRFKGHALALSGHFLDIDMGGNLDPFMANTAGYKGSHPTQSETLTLDHPQSVLVEPPVLSSLQDITLHDAFSAHAAIMRKHIDKYGGKKLSEQGQLELVHALRQSVQPQLNVA